MHPECWDTWKLSLSFLTSSPSLVFWGFIRATIASNSFTGHLRCSSLKAMKQHSCFSILFLSNFYIPISQLSEAARYGGKDCREGLQPLFSRKLKILGFLKNYRNKNYSRKCADDWRGAEVSQLEKFYWIRSYQTLHQYILMLRVPDVQPSSPQAHVLCSLHVHCFKTSTITYYSKQMCTSITLLLPYFYLIHRF